MNDLIYNKERILSSFNDIEASIARAKAEPIYGDVTTYADEILTIEDSGTKRIDVNSLLVTFDALSTWIHPNGDTYHPQPIVTSLGESFFVAKQNSWATYYIQAIDEIDLWYVFFGSYAHSSISQIIYTITICVGEPSSSSVKERKRITNTGGSATMGEFYHLNKNETLFITATTTKKDSKEYLTGDVRTYLHLFLAQNQ